MTKRIIAVLLMSALAVPAFASKNKFKMIHVSDLAVALKSANPPSVFDANTDDVRAKNGVIPGAHLLPSYDKFDVAKVLPTDKSAALVFYCANTMCTASHYAAKKAIKAGYTNVSVMSDGIMGWAKAGQPVQKVDAGNAPQTPASATPAK